jgi:hypothetical protein
MMKILQKIQKIKESRMSTKDKQRSINVSEAFHLWNHLTQRYSVLHSTETLEPFARDGDLKIILTMGKNSLSKNISLLEKEVAMYGLPLPLRPPKRTNVSEIADPFTDRYIYRRILRGIQAFLPTHTMAFMHSTTPKIRDLFFNFMIEEMKIYDKYIEYGKLKGYVVIPPTYSQ